MLVYTSPRHGPARAAVTPVTPAAPAAVTQRRHWQSGPTTRPGCDTGTVTEPDSKESLNRG
jgi:hypothetical protein